MRCYLRAEVNECARWFPDVELSGTSGLYKHPRTVMVDGVVTSARSSPTADEGALTDGPLSVHAARRPPLEST